MPSIAVLSSSSASSATLSSASSGGIKRFFIFVLLIAVSFLSIHQSSQITLFNNDADETMNQPSTLQMSSKTKSRTINIEEHQQQQQQRRMENDHSVEEAVVAMATIEKENNDDVRQTAENDSEKDNTTKLIIEAISGKSPTSAVSSNTEDNKKDDPLILIPNISTTTIIEPSKQETPSLITTNQKKKGKKRKEPEPTPPNQDPVIMSNYVLQPPFQIIQVGNPRSGTTFQFNLLDAIISLKTPNGTQTPQGLNRGFISGWKDYAYRIRVDHQTPFLLKFHKTKPIFKELQWESIGNFTNSSPENPYNPHYGVFSSGVLGSSYSLYVQNYDNLLNCSSCEIENYKQVFNLTDQDVETLKNHMYLYTIIRQCCGLQMSKYEVYRLNGCNVTSFQSKGGYPNCESHDMPDIEQRLWDSPIQYQTSSPRNNWRRPGDCDMYRKKIASGLQFMGKPFEGCPEGT